MSDPAASPGRPLPVVGGRARLIGDWALARVSGHLEGAVVLRLERTTDGATVHLKLSPRGAQALAQTRFGALSYGAFDKVKRDEVVELVRRVAGLLESGALPLWALFPHLSLPRAPGPDDRPRIAQLFAAQARGLLPAGPSDASVGESLLPPVSSSVVFDPPGLADLFAPQLVIDGTAVAGYRLAAIYLPPVGKRVSNDVRSFILDFEHVPDGVTPAADALAVVRLKLSIDPAETGLGRAGPLTLSVLGFTGDVDQLPSRSMSLASWVLTLLRAKVTESTQFTIAPGVEALRAMSIPADRGVAAAAPTPADTNTPDPAPETTRAAALNLAIDADCGQSCVFCSVKSYLAPVDGGDTELEQLALTLRRSREQGIDELRLNGIDPLAFSRVVELVTIARDLGFRRMTVFTPGRRLADPVFRRAFLAAAPTDLLVSIPVYGTTAAVHDAVTGRPGAFAEVMSAIDGVLRERGPAALALSTVVVRRNVQDFPAIVAFASERGLRLDSKLAYPMRQTTRDPFVEAAARESDVLEVLVSSPLFTPARDTNLGAWSMMGAVLAHPCIAWHAEKRTGLPVFGAEPRNGATRFLPGTEYRNASFVHGGTESGAGDAFAVATVPCPHAAACALAPVCPKEHFAVYAQCFGLDEFRPVTPWELYEQGKAALEAVYRARPPST